MKDTYRHIDAYIMLMAFALWLSLAWILALTAVSEDVPEPIPFGLTTTPEDMRAELPELYWPVFEKFLPGCVEEVQVIRRAMGEVTFPRVRINLKDTHRMFITSYCSAECGGSTMTSSGARVHRANHANRYSEPTTCAIDLRYFSYHTYFYIPSEDRVYVAEDTGSGVKGMWLDTYQLDYATVQSYNTRYETIYTCEVEYYDILADNYNIHWYILENYLAMIIESEEFIDERL